LLYHQPSAFKARKKQLAMDRTLSVHVKKNTWPGPGKLPGFPPAFHSGVETHDIHIPSMLLLVGYLTTPTSAAGVSLSEFWAWVRYLAAVTNGGDLRLTRSFFDLDAHQKTILSDDFGMGVPMLWLSQRLSLTRIVDGRYFMRRIAASVGAAQRRTAKRGPNKTPDFVARDASGVWHVVECKGTQSGDDYCNRQLGERGPPPSGGIAQKRSIVFPAAYTGQRLVCGLSIGVENGARSRLTIIDPEPDEPFRLDQDQMSLADDAAERGMIGKALRLAGFETTAEATAAPLGPSPSSMRYKSRLQEEAREEFVAERDARAQAELARMERVGVAFGDGFLGRELQFALPRPVLIDEFEVTRVILRQGVDQDLLAQLREQPTYTEPTFDKRFATVRDGARSVATGEERSATMKIGGVFRSEMYLE
jgi:hypothetical protein